MLAPGLGQRFELAVGRLAAELGEVPLDAFISGGRASCPDRLRCKSSASFKSRIGTETRRNR